MKTLDRKEVGLKFDEIIEKYGKPKKGNIFCENQLIAKIVHDLGGYDETNITYQNGEFKVSPDVCVCGEYSNDHTFIGTVKAVEWFSQEQLKALHEFWFGYQF